MYIREKARRGLGKPVSITYNLSVYDASGDLVQISTHDRARLHAWLDLIGASKFRVVRHISTVDSYDREELTDIIKRERLRA